MPDVYTYDKMPEPFRVQVVHIWNEALGNERHYQIEHLGTREAYQLVVETLCREYGTFSLASTSDGRRGRNYRWELIAFLLEEQNSAKALDAIELAFRVIDRMTRDYGYLNRPDASGRVDAAIDELNGRFREHAIGYQFCDGEIIRVDSEFVHAEAVKPALEVLRAREYAGAQAEFLKGHEHYRRGRTKEALAECLKAFESVMKVICAKRGWKHDPNATSRVLLQLLFDKNLIPAFWNQHFSALRSTLESGVPTARNRLGGHGQGTQLVEVPGYLTGYIIHLTPIVFLAEADRNLS